MKIWADLSSVARLAALCVLIGFVLGIFVACSSTPDPAVPDVAVPAVPAVPAMAPLAYR
ncbi:hypothetical protein [Actinoplanes sp. NPDC051851]|uniref:hypothetical protein n=1 Tax=Actinoplanes sp. NPDC051851 TaxID=3154753 RepID=UPI00341579D8